MRVLPDLMYKFKIDVIFRKLGLISNETNIPSNSILIFLICLPFNFLFFNS